MLYFAFEIKFNSIVSGERSYFCPKIKIYEGGTNNKLTVYLFNGPLPEDEFVLAVARVKNLNQARLEFAIQNATGTIVIKNSQLLSSPPASTFAFSFNTPSNTSCSIDINTAEKHSFVKQVVL